MKKYFLIGLMIISSDVFTQTSLVERWKKSDVSISRIIWKNLDSERKVNLVLNLIDDASDKLKECFRDISFLYFMQGSKLYQHLIPHANLIDPLYFGHSIIHHKLNDLFEQVYSIEDINAMQALIANINRYYELLQNYARSKQTSLKNLTESVDIVALLMQLTKNNTNVAKLSGKFAQKDSNEQKLLKQYLLQKEADNFVDDESDRWSVATE